MSEYRPILSERPEDILKAIEWAREEQRKILNEGEHFEGTVMGNKSKSAESKAILAEVQEMFQDDKGWDSEESMIADMATFRKKRIS